MAGHGSRTLLCICDHSGCKVWLWSMQNHARDRFKAHAHCHLKWLCFSVVILADALLIFDPRTESALRDSALSRSPQQREWQHFLKPKASWSKPAAVGPLPPTRDRPAFVLATGRLTCQSDAGARPQELCYWFCSQNLRLLFTVL